MLQLLLHGTKKKKERKDEVPLAVKTQDSLFKGFRQEKVLGAGCFGAVWSFVPSEEKRERSLADPRDYQTLLPELINKLIQARSPTKNPKFILKVRILGDNLRYLDSFVREVYFLQLLRDTGYVPSLIHHAEITVESNPIGETKIPMAPNTAKKASTAAVTPSGTLGAITTATAATTTTAPSVTPATAATDRRGLQVMERFQGNASELGNLQAKQIGLSSSEHIVAFTWMQIRQMAFLAMRLDEMGISHGDFKLTNLLYRLLVSTDRNHAVPLAAKPLYKEPEYDLRVADFGFAGFLHTAASSIATTANVPYVAFAPLVGFWGNLGCSTKRKSTQKQGELVQFFLDEPIPVQLHSHINRLQLYVMLLEMKSTYVANLETKKSTKLLQEDLAKLLDVNESHLQLLSIYLPRIKRCLSTRAKQLRRAWRKQ